MNIYRIISGTKLYSFGDDIKDVQIHRKSLGNWQNEIVSNMAYKLIDIKDKNSIKEKEYIIFSEDLFFTTLFFKEIINAINNTNTCLQFVLESNDFNIRFVLPTTKNTEGLHYFNIQYINGSSKIEKCVIPQNIYSYDASIPSQIVKGGIYAMPQCECFAAQLISPFHLLQVNIAMNLNRTLVLQKNTKKGIEKYLKGRLGSFIFYSALKRINKIGKNCFIHPSAIIEGSIIGDNVRIGANTIVRLSQIGNNCTLSDNVVVSSSVLGARTYISNSNFIAFCMTFEEVFLIHGPYQFSIFGRNSSCFAVINCDIRLDQENIKIPTSEGIIDSSQPLLGIAYGHHSKTSGGNIIAAGRIVPNNYHIKPPDTIILKFNK